MLNEIICIVKKNRGSYHYLINRVRVNRVVEAGIEIVEKVNHLKGCRTRGYGCEANDVREINRDLAKLLGIDGHAELQFLGDRTRNTEPKYDNFFPKTLK